MNRISTAVAAVQAKLDELTPAAVAELDAAMAVEFDEHFAYQNAQARAHASGKLSTDEAQVVYIALGEVGSTENGGWADGTSTATKVTVTRLMAELLAR